MSEDKQLSREELAIQRTELAADRTLMAWCRTAVSLISFGFTIYKFLQYVREEGGTGTAAKGPRNLGMALISMGVVFLLLGCVQFWQQMRRLRPAQRLGPWRLTLIFALLLALLGVLALANVMYKVGPF